MKKLLISTLIAATFVSTWASAETLTESQEKQLIEINELLRSNPSVIESLHESLEQYVASQAQFKNVKEQSHDWLYNTPEHSITGNPNGKSVIINFTDYNCPFCKKMEVVLAQLAEENNDLKVVNIYVPLQQQLVAGIDTNSALYALNVWREQPEAFIQVHDLLVAKNGRHTKQSLEAVAKKTDTIDLLKTSDEQQMIIARNYQTFTALGLGGTPGMLIGDQVIPGYVPYEKLKEVIEAEFSK
ncbi:DsbA family protein [Vibrio profundi]|uniref:DsbA family protein n=1 Tax=Vibrio profundi TaxID=1774960 RepID=UPI003736640D